jgi:hypothetical protein
MRIGKWWAFGVALAAALGALVPAAPAWAHGRAVVGVGIGVGGVWAYPPAAYPGPGWPYYRPYYRPYYGPYYRPYWYPPAVVVPPYPATVYPPAVVTVRPSQPVYVEQSQPSTIPAEPPTAQVNWWYWCAEAQGYYPYVRQCPGVWQRVPPQPPPPSAAPPASQFAPAPAPPPGGPQ